MFRSPLIDLDGAEANRRRLLEARQREAVMDIHASNGERRALSGGKESKRRWDGKARNKVTAR